MTKREFVQVLEVLEGLYPKFELTNKQKGMWYECLNDLELDKAIIAVKQMVMIEHFAPSIAKIRQHYAEICSPKRMSDSEGWGLVAKAIRNYGYMRAEEALASLPEEVQIAVQHVGGFQAICESENMEVMRGQFNKAMGSINGQKTKGEQVSLEVQSAIAKIEQDAMLRELLED